MLIFELFFYIFCYSVIGFLTYMINSEKDSPFWCFVLDIIFWPVIWLIIIFSECFKFIKKYFNYG